MGADDGCFPILHRPSPNVGRVGFYNCPFGACSRFTRVTACQVAAAQMAYICPQSFSRKVSLSHCLGSYRDKPSISRTGLSPVGNLRLRGAPTYSISQFRRFSPLMLAFCLLYVPRPFDSSVLHIVRGNLQSLKYFKSFVIRCLIRIESGYTSRFATNEIGSYSHLQCSKFKGRMMLDFTSKYAIILF